MPASTDHSRFVADAVAAGVDAIDNGSRPELVMAAILAERIRAWHYGLGTLDMIRGSAEFALIPEPVDRGLIEAEVGRVAASHLDFVRWLSGRSDVLASSTLIRDPGAWRLTRTYWILLRGLGCTEGAGIRLTSGPDMIRILGFTRDRAFAGDELGLLRNLARPLRALQCHADHVETRPLAKKRGEEEGARLEGARTAARPSATLGTWGLTDREFEVLDLLAQGLPASTIAARLGISPRTVHRHLTAVYSKLGTHDRLTTVLRGQELGILTSPGSR